MKKKGKAQANIITTVLIVLLVIVGVTIIFNVVKPLVSEKSGEIETGFQRLMLSNLEIPSWIDNEDGSLNITVHRGVGEGNFSGLKFGLQTDSGICYAESPGTLSELETQTFLVLTGECGNVKEIVSVQGADTNIVYINSCQELDESNMVYYLTNDLSDSEVVKIKTSSKLGIGACFDIRADDVVLDCNGYSITSSSGSSIAGAYIGDGINRVIVKNCNFDLNLYHGHGVYIDGASNASIINNTLIGKLTGITVAGDYNNIINNTINNKNNYYQSVDVSGSYNLIQGNDVTSGGFHGIYINNDAKYNSIIDNYIHYVVFGIGLRQNADNNIIKNNNIYRAGTGVSFYNSDNNLIESNVITGSSNTRGLRFTSSKGNTIKSNRICDNGIKDIDGSGGLFTNNICDTGRTCSQVCSPPEEIVNYGKISIINDPSTYGVFDLALEYKDENKGYMVYTSLDSLDLLHTHLASSIDNGKTWTFVKRLNQGFEGEIVVAENDILTRIILEMVGLDPDNLTGAFVNEVPTLVYVPDDIGNEWKLFWHRYLLVATPTPLNPNKRDRILTHSWIMFKQANSLEELDIAPEIRLFGTEDLFEPAQLNFENYIGEDVLMSSYTEPASLYMDGVLYMALSWFGVPETDSFGILFLIKSIDYGATWEFIDTILTPQDGEDFGFKHFTAASLAEENGRVFLLTSPVKEEKHLGTYIFEFENFEEANLKRDGTGNLTVNKILLPSVPEGNGGNSGESDYDKYNTYGGIVMSEIDLRDFPKIAGIYNTKQMMLI